MFEFESIINTTLEYVNVIYDVEEGDPEWGSPDYYDITILDLDGKDITDTISDHDRFLIDKEVRKHYGQTEFPCE